MNKQQFADLNIRMSDWNWESKLALKNPKLFVLEQSRKDFMRIVGTEGVALARWQLEVLAFFGLTGEAEQAVKQERERIAKEVESIFEPYPRDTVWYVTGRDILERVLRQPAEKPVQVVTDNADPARIYRWLDVKTKQGIEQVKVVVGTLVQNTTTTKEK
jgi:hypothetical protein